MQKILLVLSFDHELSLGGVRSYQQNLFEPAEALLDTANALGVPICLFTDILCHLRFQDWDRAGFCAPYERQLRRALREGHDVQLHLHPHWLEVGFEEGRFNLGNRYSLGDFAQDPAPNDMEGIVKRGLTALAAIGSAANPGYRCLAYRAGGYSFGPAEAQQTEILWRKGIRFDSSVAKGYYLKTRSSLVNFRGMPSRANWYIEPGGTLAAAGTRGLFEVPIACCRRTPLNNLPFLMKRVIARGRRRDSGGTGFHEHKDSFWQRISRLFPRSVWMLSFDSFTETARELVAILGHYLERHANDETVYCSAIGHPKSMGPHQLRLFRDFVGRAREVYGGALSFTTFQAIARSRGL